LAAAAAQWACAAAVWLLVAARLPAQQAMPPSDQVGGNGGSGTAPVVNPELILPGGSLQTQPPLWSPSRWFDGMLQPPATPRGCDVWTWQLIPEGLIYKNYLAGDREPRLGVEFVGAENSAFFMDATAGAHVGLVRYGTEGPVWPEGFELDAEAAAFPRLLMDSSRALEDVDFRIGIPLSWRSGILESKFGYYHLCSHLGDLFMLANPGFTRVEYVRDSLVAGFAIRPAAAVRLYAEADWAFYAEGDAQPWQFQFGAEYSSMEPTGAIPDPFFAINGRLRQELNFSGNITVQTGLQWRSQSQRLLRVGFHYFNGLCDYGQFYNRFEQQIGAGIWYDF
jgi:hypothetical protein